MYVVSVICQAPQFPRRRTVLSKPLVREAKQHCQDVCFCFLINKRCIQHALVCRQSFLLQCRPGLGNAHASAPPSDGCVCIRVHPYVSLCFRMHPYTYARVCYAIFFKKSHIDCKIDPSFKPCKLCFRIVSIRIECCMPNLPKSCFQ